MGLMQRAYETYEANRALAGVAREGHAALCPLGCILQKAQIEIHLRADGSFQNALKIPAEDARTAIPATEKSASRTSGDVAHPLCDQLMYIAPYDAGKHEKYLAALSAWAESEYAHPMLTPVLAYARGRTILRDLAAAEIIKLSPGERAPAEGKLEGVEYGKCLIRWVVAGAPCWQNASLFQAFERYSEQTLNAGSAQGLCMITGALSPLCASHDKGIIAAHNGAKLVSTNDETGFTYRGRFTEALQACSIGWDASQKAHKALTYAASEYGKTVGGRTFACWSPRGEEVFNPLSGLLADEGEALISEADYRKALSETLAGYRNRLPARAGVVIAAFDAATTGRLALTYYNELLGSDYCARVQRFYETCVWPNGKFGMQSPLLIQIAHFAFGAEQSGLVKANDKLARDTVQRLLPCMVDAAPIPSDIARALANRASQPQAYARGNWRKLLFIACAVMRKTLNDRLQREEWTTMLDPEKKDRSYQYGRLLAILEAAERATYKDEDREPNAIRMQSVFRERPFYAANIVNERLNPYFQRMPPGLRAYYRNLIGAALSVIHEFPEAEWNRALEDTYLMGYYLQRAELYAKKRGANEEETQEETEE